MGKLAMLMKYRLPVKVIIVKHTMRGMIALERIAYVGNPQYGVQSKPIEFEAVPKGCGIPVAKRAVPDDDPLRSI
jgi:pyruvate dehydrogenase (quinone)